MSNTHTLPKTYMGKQLEHAVRACGAFCHSKRSDKFNDAVDTEWKVYSDSYKQDMVDLARDFGRFLTANYPHIRNSYEIGQAEVQAFMNKKASTCAPTTLTTKISKLWKLEKCCIRISCSKNQEKFHWNTSDIIMPKSTKEIKYKKDKPIPIEHSRTILADMQKNRSETVNAATLSAYTGMRARETTCLKVENVHFTNGEFGLGWIQIIKGSEGGAKAGKARIIPILDLEAQNALKSIVAGKKPDDYVVISAKGGKMGPDNVEKAICTALKARFGNTYLYNDGHGMRKTFAQKYYDMVRSKHTRKETISKTNMVLGHGKNRGEQGIKSYVANKH